MDRALACGASASRFDSRNMFFLDVRKEKEPDMIKMPIDLASPSSGIIITVLAVPSMGKHSIRASNGT